MATFAKGLGSFAAAGGDLYAVTGNQMKELTSSGSPILTQSGGPASFTLPSKLTTNEFNGSSLNASQLSQPVIGPRGDIYLASYYAGLVAAFSPTGSELWTADPGKGLPTGIFALSSTSGSFELGVTTTQNHASSYVLNPASGAQVGSVPLLLRGGYASQAPNGDIFVSNGNGYVQTWNAQGTEMLSQFGSPSINGKTQHTGGPFDFFYPGQSILASDGNIWSADGLDQLTETTPQGFLVGATSVGGALDSANIGGSLAEEGGNLFLATGPPFGANAISEIPLSAAEQWIAEPHKPLDSLGWGAGLSTPADGNYFPSGSTVTVDAKFASWWAQDAPDLQLDYSVWNQRSLTKGTTPTPTTVALPTSASSLASIPLHVPTADTNPGPYQVQVTLLDTASSPPQVLGSTCLPYTVGAPGDRLNLSSLPPGSGAGGPADQRGVVLNSQLGLDGFRGTGIDWSTFLPGCNPSLPNASTCGPSAMAFANAPDSYFQAAYLAKQDHVAYWVQVTGGDPTSRALVQGGWWQGDIEALARYYSSPPAGCSNCAPVTAWEPWNEANNTGWSNPSSYVKQVLAPFYAGVKAASGSDTVIGGSSLGIPIGWWQGLIAAGGLRYMDVASVHPYPGNNDSWAEDGIPGQVRQLQGLLGSTPLWFTEVGWWSNGSYDYLAQADNVARAMIWQKVLGIPVWNYFFDEGSWGNDGVSFSLIQTSSAGDDYVKPAALATMTTSNMTAGRPFLSTPKTGIPQAYEADFGTTPGGSTGLSAIWTDGLSTHAAVSVTSASGGSVPVTITDEYGASTTDTLTSGTRYDLPISDQVSYISYPTSAKLSVAPPVAFGTDLALASAGATATASSNSSSAASVLANPQVSTTGYGQGWSSAAGDTTPTLTVHLSHATTVDRVLVDTQSVGSVAQSLRDYTISAETTPGNWSTVGTENGEFWNHAELISFDPVSALAVRITVSKVNVGGYFDGGVPSWWSPSSPTLAFVHAVEVYAGTATPAQVDGSGLTALGGVPTSAPSGSASGAPSGSGSGTTPSGGSGSGGGGGGGGEGAPTGNSGSPGGSGGTTTGSSGSGGSSPVSPSPVASPSAPQGQAPSFTSPSSATFVAGRASSFTVSADANPDQVTYRLDKAPSWLSIDPSTGKLTGRPSASAPGRVKVTLEAKNPVGTSTQTLTIAVERTPVVRGWRLLGWRTGRHQVVTWRAATAQGTSMRVIGTLPKGLSWHAASGRLAVWGRPWHVGHATFTIVATNRVGGRSVRVRLVVLR